MKWYFFESYPTFTQTIPAAFRQIGIPLLLPNPEIRPVELEAKLRREKPDVILMSGLTPLLKEPYLAVVRKYAKETNALVVYWSLEDPIHTETWGMAFVQMAEPDYVFTHHRMSPPVYHRLGIPSSYLSLACNPELHRSVAPVPEYADDIAVVANFSTATHCSYRLESLKVLLRPLLEAGYRVGIWGRDWMERKGTLPFHVPECTIRGTIPYEHVPKVYSSAKIVLGLQNDQHLVTRRTFECLGSGGFLLTVHTDEVQRLFHPGKHLVSTRSANETLRAVSYYLERPDERRAIARDGQREVRRRHTFVHRVQTIVREIEPYYRQKRRRGSVNFHPRGLRKTEVKPDQACSVPRNHYDAGGQFLTIGGRGDRCRRIAFLRFPLPEDLYRPGFEVARATLHLYLAYPAQGETVVGCFPVVTDWTAESLELGRLPEWDQTPITTFSVYKAYQWEYPFTNNWHTADLTHMVRRWLSREVPNHGVCLRMRQADRFLLRFTSMRWKGSNGQTESMVASFVPASRH